MPPMPRVPPFDRPATYEDLVALDEIFIAEIVNGELHHGAEVARAEPFTEVAIELQSLWVD